MRIGRRLCVTFLEWNPHMAHAARDNESNASVLKHSFEAESVPFFDLARQSRPLREKIVKALARVCDSGQFVLGPECGQLEESLAEYCQVKHAVACASGSDALLLALMACGIEPADEVLLPSYTFFATAGAVWRLGARPVFVDIDPATYCIDPKVVESHITARTRAIIPVHLYGQCANMRELSDIARQHDLALIEDAAQAIGSEYEGKRAGTLGDVGCFSFYPTKNLGGFGDGGFMTTNDDEIAKQLKMLRVHGETKQYHHQIVGFNSRLDSFQAAVLNAKLPHLEHWITRRQANARYYDRLFREHGLHEVIGLPHVAENRRHVWNQYVVRVPGGQRDALREFLAGQNVGTAIYYPVPMHEQPCFATLGYELGRLPETEAAARETLALPIFPELTAHEQQRVVTEIASFYGAQKRPTTGYAIRPPKFLSKRNSTHDSEVRAPRE